jgi:predicted membrane metal-binding protein
VGLDAGRILAFLRGGGCSVCYRFRSGNPRRYWAGGRFGTEKSAPKVALAAALARWLAGLAGALREQWVVTLALTPLSLLLFNQVSLVGLLANAVAIPLVTLVITPLALLGVLWAPVWLAAAWAVSVLALFLQWLASWPSGLHQRGRGAAVVCRGRRGGRRFAGHPAAMELARAGLSAAAAGAAVATGACAGRPV